MRLKTLGHDSLRPLDGAPQSVADCSDRPPDLQTLQTFDFIDFTDFIDLKTSDLKTMKDGMFTMNKVAEKSLIFG